MNRIDEIKEVRESVMRIKLMRGMSGVIDLIDDLASEAERLAAERDEWRRKAEELREAISPLIREEILKKNT